MKLVKSLLLAAPATIIAVAVAQAADLPIRKAAPIEYVRICDAYGSGFFYIPGTNTCLHVGGYVRAEYEYTPGHDVMTANPRIGVLGVNDPVSQVAANQDTTGMQARGRVDLDARTQTPWGTAQTVIWLRGASQDGIKVLANPNSTFAAIQTGAYVPANAADSIILERAFIRFAGITAGKATDNFTTMPPYMLAGIFAGFPVGVKELAYTATFGGGFSATISLESRADTGNSSNVGLYTYNYQWDTGYNMVDNIRYDASWGFVQLEGALGNNSYATGLNVVPNSVTLVNLPRNNPLAGPTTQSAWAIGLSGMFKLPMISPGDQFNWFAAYGHGMFGLIGCTQGISDCPDPANARWLGGLLRYDQNLIPVNLDGAGNVIFGTTNTWSLNGLYTHYWTPEWRSNFAVLYQKVLEPTANPIVGLQLGDANVWVAGANLIWSPTRGFNIGVEIDYMHMDQTLQNDTAANVGAGPNNVSANYFNAGSPGLSNSGWTGRLRLEREF